MGISCFRCSNVGLDVSGDRVPPASTVTSGNSSEPYVARESAVLERAMGIEPTSSAWEAEVMAIIRRPQNAQFYRDLAGDGKRGVLAGGSETGMARCWSGGVAGSGSRDRPLLLVRPLSQHDRAVKAMTDRSCALRVRCAEKEACGGPERRYIESSAAGGTYTNFSPGVRRKLQSFAGRPFILSKMIACPFSARSINMLSSSFSRCESM